MIDTNILFEEHRRLLNLDITTSNLPEKSPSETENGSRTRQDNSAKQMLDVAEEAKQSIEDSASEKQSIEMDTRETTPSKKSPKEPREASISGRLLSSASHDIRTSLTGIVGMAQLVSDTELNTEQRSCIEAVQQSSHSLLKTINYVLDISRIESGQMELNETTADLHSLCKKIAQTLRPLANLKSLSLSCVCDDNVPLSIMYDENLMERMISNLLQNSIDNTDQGSVSLNIKCQGKSQKGADFVFHISDTRSNITSNAQHSKTSLPPEENTASDSEGMDQIIARHLIDILGGTLEVCEENESGYSSSVHMTLRQASRPAPMQISSRDRIKNIIKPNLKILLVEDNKLNQKVVEKLLSKEGCEVDTVENGTMALEQIQKGSYDLIIMDCQMPVMDGYEATEAIRNMEAPASLIPIIALTAHAMEKDEQKCLECGMDDYLSKPIERQELIDLINKYTAN